MTRLSQFVQSYIQLHPEAAANVIESKNREASLAYLIELSTPDLAALIPHLSSHLLSLVLEQLPAGRAAEVFQDVPDSICALALQHLLPEKRLALVAEMDPVRMKHINRLLSFVRGTAASIMDSTVPSVLSSETVGRCIERLKSAKHKTIYYLYLVDPDYKLCGVMNLKELLHNSGFIHDPLAAYMSREVTAVFADMTIENLQKHPAWFRYHALPVTDRRGRYLGVIQYETIKRYELENRGARRSSELLETGNALGELYTLGVFALLGAASSVATKQPESPDES
ncbi:MAG: hypothetical protein U5L07_00095 [Desulfobacterales bacterium]|nr:hypothetical protein [Desulfobacterales bacterium]